MQSNRNRSVFFPLAMLLAFASGCAQPKIERGRSVGGSCEDCELMVAGMPAALSWKAKLAADDEPGEPLIISGTIYKSDGKTPAQDVILYVYHTDHTGRYTPGPNQVHARKHGHLRGWVKTDAQGRHEFRTIRPAAYPEGKDPHHIHGIIKRNRLVALPD